MLRGGAAVEGVEASAVRGGPVGSVDAMSRKCARPGCSQSATATLTYQYAAQAAWLERLSTESHPMTHDLCEAHADRLSVPQGWRLEDRRVVSPILPRFQAQLAS